jgi:hypothetical protein
VHTIQKRFDDPGVIVAHTGKRNHSLKTNFGALIRKCSTQPLRRTTVTDFSKRGDRHLSHVHVGVFHRHEQGRKRFASANVRKAKRSRGSYRRSIVVPKRTFEHANDILAGIVGMFDEVTYGAFTHRRLFRGYVAKGRRKGSR